MDITKVTQWATPFVGEGWKEKFFPTPPKTLLREFGELRRALKNGKHPLELGGRNYYQNPNVGRFGARDGRPVKDMGVYKIGRFWVKPLVGRLNDYKDKTRPVEAFKKMGLRAANRSIVGLWEIQPDYGKPISEQPFDSPAREKWVKEPFNRFGNPDGQVFDLHLGNFTLDRRGRYVAFDW